MINMPLGIRINNPGNIVRTHIKWQGMSPAQIDPRFISFVNPSWGFRAMARVLREYFKEGANTVNLIISKYAPSAENNTEAYIKDVAERLNVNPDQVLVYEEIIFNLLKAITWHEQGMFPYEDSVVQLGINLEDAV